jgi:hypothetical protein
MEDDIAKFRTEVDRFVVDMVTIACEVLCEILCEKNLAGHIGSSTFFFTMLEVIHYHLKEMNDWKWSGNSKIPGISYLNDIRKATDRPLSRNFVFWMQQKITETVKYVDKRATAFANDVDAYCKNIEHLTREALLSQNTYCLNDMVRGGISHDSEKNNAQKQFYDRYLYDFVE